jgi:bla regulator protein BlaR1
MGTIISILNKAGEIFCQHGMTMLVQFGLLTSLLFLADILIRKRVKASLRYCLWILVLIKLVLPTTLTLPTGIGDLTGVNFSVQLTQAKLPEPQIQTVHAPTISMPVQTGGEFTRPINSPQDIAESRIFKVAESPASAETIPLSWQGGIFIAWLFGVLALLAGFIRRIASIKKLINQSKPASERLVDMVHNCQERIGVKGIVELRLSNDMVSPAVCGLLRHVIIVPTGLLEKMDRSKLAMVLMHELSHVKRADLWVNFIQTILQIFYFYNPFVWAANAYIRRVREQAVDEMVLTRLNGAVASYSSTLIDIAEKAFSRPQFRLATVSILESKSKLQERIKIMLSKPIPKDTKIGFAGLVLIIAVAAVLLPMAKAKDGGAVDNHLTVMVKESAGIDVGVEDFNIMPYPEGGLYTVTVSIRNRGRAESPKFGVNFYRGDPNNVKPMTHGAGPIKPGDVWKEGSMPFALKEGTNEIVVLLDPDNTIGEPNRTNNEASMTVIVKDGKIVEKKVSLSSAKGIGKETTGISDQVINAAEFGDTNSNNTAGYIDLLKQYPTTLTGESTNPQDAREWQFTPQDIYSISRFSFDVNNALQIKIGPADIGIGHCKDGAVWAVVIPREHGTIKSLTFGEELIDHLWLRFHPREVSSLFPKDTIIAGGDKNLWGRMNEIAKVKMNNSWQAGGRAMIPAPKDFTVDADTKKNVRRFFIVDSEAKTAKYVAVFEGRTVPAQTSSSPPVVVKTTPKTLANDVSADLNQLTVTFSQQMKDKSWAWVQLDAPYPETTGKPYYDEEKKTCTLPVKLEPG